MKLDKLFQSLLLTSSLAFLLVTPATAKEVGEEEISKNIPLLSDIEAPITNALTLAQTPTPTQGSVVVITGVKANPTEKGVEVILETSLGDKLRVANRSTGNNFIADITDGQLRLPNGDSFTYRSEKPISGITEITVTNIDENTVRVTVVGKKALPAVELFDDDAGLIFAVTETPQTQTPSEQVYVLYYYTSLLSEPIEQIRNQFEEFQQAEASIYRIQDLLQVQSQLSIGGETQLPHGALSVNFENVSFSYCDQGVGDEDLVLQNISFNLPAGHILGLLGHTGSGKSSLARLLLRLYDPQSGRISLGSVPIDQSPLIDLPQKVGLVTQDVQLFQTTVRNNLTFFNQNISDERIYETLEILGLSTWLHSLPQGLDTNLGPDSSGLSAGQAQLLAFTRVFLKNPGLVILDEASSRLDPITEKLIEKAVDRLFTGRTGIIIAHRLATVQKANQILILEQGRVSEYGQREKLAKNPQSRFYHLLQAGLTDY